MIAGKARTSFASGFGLSAASVGVSAPSELDLDFREMAFEQSAGDCWVGLLRRCGPCNRRQRQGSQCDDSLHAARLPGLTAGIAASSGGSASAL